MAKRISDVCYGCGLCAEICPKKIITIKKAEDGSQYAFFDENQCIHCNKCHNICIAKKKNENRDFYKPVAFCGWSKELETVKSSSSGGVFYEIASDFIKNGGYVCGVVYSNDFRKTQHIVTNKPEDLKKMQGSKYIDSDFRSCIPQITKQLLNNNKVLFAGTPCQCAAVKKRFPNENIFYIDLICNGAGYQEIMEKEIDRLEELHDSSIVSYSMRYKKDNYFPLYMHAKYLNGDEDIVPFYETNLGKIYGSRIALKSSCYNCGFKGFPRYSDITLGDYHDFAVENRTISSKFGASTIIINSEKGYKYMMELCDKNKLNLLQAKSFNEVIKNNGRLVLKGYAPSKNNRKKFKKNLSQKGILEATKLCNKYYRQDKVICRKLYEKIEMKKMEGKYEF